MLGWMRNPEEVGLYKVAYQTASLIPFGLMAVNTAIAPTLAKLYSIGKKDALKRTIIAATAIALLFASPLFFSFLLAGPWVINHLYGNAYIEASTVLAILSIGFFFNTISGVSWQFLIMSGQEHKLLVILLLTVTIYLLLNATIIPLWGVEGAVITKAFSLAVITSLVFCALKLKPRRT